MWLYASDDGDNFLFIPSKVFCNFDDAICRCYNGENGQIDK